AAAHTYRHDHHRRSAERRRRQDHGRCRRNDPDRQYGGLPLTQPPVAVFDLGKTNSKLFVVSAEGAILDETRRQPLWRDQGDVRVLDDETLFAWMKTELARVVEAHGVDRITFSGHGCTFALASGDRLVHPILDYEQEPPAAVAERIDALVPAFRETF